MCLVSTAVVGFDVPNLCQALQMIRNLSPDDLSLRYEATIPLERHPTIGWGVLCDNDTITVKRVCLLAWAVTSGTQVPRELQLRAFLAIHHGRDSLFIAGTGSGKTLPIALTVLLDNPTENHLSIVISPLKRLQISQVFILHLKFTVS
jgi:ATP-dependent helicase YprA (DUF1998 family)